MFGMASFGWLSFLTLFSCLPNVKDRQGGNDVQDSEPVEEEKLEIVYEIEVNRPPTPDKRASPWTYLKTSFEKSASELDETEKCRIGHGESVYYSQMEPIHKDKKAHVDSARLIKVVGVKVNNADRLEHCQERLLEWEQEEKDIYIYKPHFSMNQNDVLIERKLFALRSKGATYLKISQKQASDLKTRLDEKCEVEKDTVLLVTVPSETDEGHIRVPGGARLIHPEPGVMSTCKLLDSDFFIWPDHWLGRAGESIASTNFSGCGENQEIDFENGKPFEVPLFRKLESYEFTSDYDCERQRIHNGHDYGLATGTPLRPSAPGEVVFVATNGGYGKHIKINHLDAKGLYRTSYSHLSRFSVSNGDVVCPDETIGLVGSTGFSTGPHLHFEIRKKVEKDSNKTLNPEGLWCKMEKNPDRYGYVSYDPKSLCQNCP